jgi:tetratricopeptide (TPR) repeat protein
LNATVETPRQPATDRVFVFGAAAVVVLGLGVAAYVYQSRGAEFVDGLDEQIGDVIAVRARTHAEAGFPEAALPLFEQALETPFLDERQRMYCIQDYAGLLIEAGRADAALGWIERGIEAFPADAKLAFLRFDALRSSGRTQDAIAAAQQWFEIGQANGDVSTMRAARFAEGTVHRDSQNGERALQAFLAAHELAPGADTAVRAAQLYLRLGRSEAARDLLEFAATDPGTDGETARGLLESLK